LNPSDHTPFTFNTITTEEFIQDKQHTIIKNSKKEKKIIPNLIHDIRNINTLIILNINSSELIVQEYASIPESI